MSEYIELKGRTSGVTVAPETGLSLLDLALRHGADFAFSCTRGTCGRCRCQVEEGLDHLSPVTDAEWERLDDDLLDGGYRLACQAVVKSAGTIRAVHKPIF